MQNTTLSLSEQQLSAISAHCEDGDNYLEKGDCAQAEHHYGLAWDLLPEPKIHWEVAATILATLGDSYWFGEKTETALETFEFALLCEGAVSNPYLHFRLAQCYLALDEQAKAADEFKLAKEYADNADFTELFEEELTPDEQAIVKGLLA